MTRIQVTDNMGDMVLLDDDREALFSYLAEASDEDYAAEVLRWYSEGAGEPLVIDCSWDADGIPVVQVFDTWQRVWDREEIEDDLQDAEANQYPEWVEESPADDALNAGR